MPNLPYAARAPALRAATLRALALGLSLLPTLPAASVEIPPPTQASAAIKAAAFAPLPRPAYVEVKLLDDSPENVRIAWEMHNALQRNGLLAKTGPTLRLTLGIDSAAMIGDEPAKPIKGREPPPGERPKLMGIFRAVLVDTSSGVRLWEAEAVYQTIWGDLAGGAMKLVPVFAEALGRSVDQRTITLR